MGCSYTIDGTEYDLTTPVSWDEPLEIRRLKWVKFRLTSQNTSFFDGFLEDFKQSDRKLINYYITLFKDIKNFTFLDTARLSASERDVVVACWVFATQSPSLRYLDFSQLFETHFSDTGESLQSILDSKGGLVVDLGETLYHSQFNDVPLGVLLDKLSGTAKKCLIICRNSCNIDTQTRSKISSNSRWSVIAKSQKDQVSETVKRF